MRASASHVSELSSLGNDEEWLDAEIPGTTDGSKGTGSVAAPRADITEGGRISGLKINVFSGSRNSTVYENWKRSVESVRYISDMCVGKLAVVTFLPLHGEARGVCQHTPFNELTDEIGNKHKRLLAVLDKR
ncbi:unnamed protein product [Prorocentrum cordatum]|uniref:Uncharacterized protein n=1 Tax=Prorocentrum cordatum TaxID=2364126 RepID=A0ABN9RTW7_9DINO|nr:unnamed protein product [Polarella glacialis]